MADTFFTQQRCDRCGHEFQPGEGRIMSKFNLDCICDASMGLSPIAEKQPSPPA